MKEQWRLVVGFEHKLAVSDLGNVVNLGYADDKGIYHPESDKKVHTHHTGYKYIVVKVDGVQKFLLLHRVVAQAFIPNPEDLPEVNHKDLNKENCSASNLEWCDRGFNMRHASSKGALVNNLPNPKKPVVAIDSKGNRTWHESINACAKSIGGFSTNISACLKGKIARYKGYTFEYA